MLFKIEMIVDGRKLERFYAAIDGLAYNVSPPVLVRGAEKKNGEVKAKNGRGDFAEHTLEQLRKGPATPSDITPQDIMKALVAAGYKKSSYSYAIEKMLQYKMIKKLRIGHYKIVE